MTTDARSHGSWMGKFFQHRVSAAHHPITTIDHRRPAIPTGPRSIPSQPRRVHMAETANSALYAFQELRRHGRREPMSCGYPRATSEYSSKHGLRYLSRHARHSVAVGY
jgi:hypothetical protein